MSGHGRLSREIQKSIKHRNRRPRPIARSLAPISTRSLRRIVDEDIHVLHAIENAIVRCWQQDTRIDDSVVNAVLRAVLLADPQSRMPHAWLFSEVAAARSLNREVDQDPAENNAEQNAEQNDELDENTWFECLRTVRDSVQRHSTLQPGDCSYLEFVERHAG